MARFLYCRSARAPGAFVLLAYVLVMSALTPSAETLPPTVVPGRQLRASTKDSKALLLESAARTITTVTAVPEAEQWSDNRLAFVFVGTEIYTRQLKCEAAIESLRSLGGWGGDIFLVTDALKCYQHERWTNCGLDANIIATDTSQLPFRRKYPIFWHDHQLKDKVLKTSILDLIDDTKAEVLMYVDCDVMFGKPVRPLVEDVVALKWDADRHMVALVDLERKEPHVEGAAWGVHTIHSRALLKAWQQQVLRSPSTSDVDALLSALRSLHPEACQGHGKRGACLRDHLHPLPPSPYLTPLVDADQDPGIMNHVPAGSCTASSVGSETVELFITRLDLCTYQDVSYCLPLYMQPFAHSWLPLPFPGCSKMELGLTRLTCQWSCTDSTLIRTSSRRTTVDYQTLRLAQ